MCVCTSAVCVWRCVYNAHAHTVNYICRYLLHIISLVHTAQIHTYSLFLLPFHITPCCESAPCVYEGVIHQKLIREVHLVAAAQPPSLASIHIHQPTPRTVHTGVAHPASWLEPKVVRSRPPAGFWEWKRTQSSHDVASRSIA